MDERRADESAVDRALQKFNGSCAAMAAAIGERIKRQHVEYWRATGTVPAAHAPAVERLTGVPVEELCPGVAWEVIRGVAAPTSHGQQEVRNAA